MDTNTTIAIVVIIFALIIVGGFIVYRQNAKVGIKVPGGKLDFEASNTPPTTGPVQPTRRGRFGIFSNLFLGKTRVEVKGGGVVADNRTLGDTEIKYEDAPAAPPPPKQRRHHK